MYKGKNDVFVDKERTRDARSRIKILEATETVPFKQIVLDKDFRSEVEAHWKDAIIIRVLGKPWFYPTLVGKLSTMWGLYGDAELLDLGNNCYVLKGMDAKTRDKF